MCSAVSCNSGLHTCATRTPHDLRRALEPRTCLYSHPVALNALCPDSALGQRCGSLSVHTHSAVLHDATLEGLACTRSVRAVFATGRGSTSECEHHDSSRAVRCTRRRACAAPEPRRSVNTGTLMKDQCALRKLRRTPTFKDNFLLRAG